MPDQVGNYSTVFLPLKIKKDEGWMKFLNKYFLLFRGQCVRKNESPSSFNFQIPSSLKLWPKDIKIIYF